jgi:hypothetical protein
MVNHDSPAEQYCVENRSGGGPNHTAGPNTAPAAFRAPARIATITLAALLTLPLGCTNQQPSAQTSAAVGTSNSVAPSLDPQITAAVRTFCGACHAVPSPSSFPRDAWYHEVQRGYQFYFDSGRTDLVIPVQSQIVAWYQSQAPESLPPAEQQSSESPVVFQLEGLEPNANPVSGLPGVSFIQFVDSESPTIWFSDMLRGRVCEMDATGVPKFELRQVAANPAGLSFADLDQNGQQDLLVADLGSPLPADHDRGQVLWVPNFRSGSQPVVLLRDVGRVADVRPGDFDDDGDPDLVVAEFGWHTTGGIQVLWNEGTAPDGSQRFRTEPVDSRPGSIHTPVCDLDGDGRLDFIALISQEHEVIDAFLSRPGGFEKVRLFAAPDPSWGSSGIEAVDFDRDGDLDLLYTAGDTFDSKVIKPFHGIWLLTNQGELRFEAQRIAAMPGVHRALAGDFDQDGDLDVAAAAILPKQALQGQPPEQLQALIWLEQIPGQPFARHCIQTGIPQHPAMVLADLNHDQRPDILTAVMAETGDDSTPSVQVFFNRGLKTAP